MLDDILIQQMMEESTLEALLDNDIDAVTESILREDYSPDDCDEDGIFPDDDEDDEGVDY